MSAEANRAGWLSEKEREQARREAYDRAKREIAAALFSTLPKGEQEIIEALAHTKANSPTGAPASLNKIIYELARARITTERHPDTLFSNATGKTIGGAE
jgi:hypothetical protein